MIDIKILKLLLKISLIPDVKKKMKKKSKLASYFEFHLKKSDQFIVFSKVYQASQKMDSIHSLCVLVNLIPLLSLWAFLSLNVLVGVTDTDQQGAGDKKSQVMEGSLQGDPAEEL